MRDKVSRGALALATLGLAACGARHSRVDSFDDCHVGLSFADCGGDNDPVLGCEADDGLCWWFTTGAVPEQVEHVSDCPADDICCHQNWPFAGDEALGAYELFSALDEAPWDRARAMDLAVAIDPALTAPATPDLTCEGAVVTGGPCDGVAYVMAYALDTPAIRISGPGGAVGLLAGWDAVVELDEPAPGQLRARVCVQPYTDVRFNQCEGNTATCATAGTITLDQWPLPSAAGAVLRLDATFAGGARITGDLAITSVRRLPAP